jgi:hypothetical protein
MKLLLMMMMMMMISSSSSSSSSKCFQICAGNFHIFVCILLFCPAHFDALSFCRAASLALTLLTSSVALLHLFLPFFALNTSS